MAEESDPDGRFPGFAGPPSIAGVLRRRTPHELPIPPTLQEGTTRFSLRTTVFALSGILVLGGCASPVAGGNGTPGTSGSTTAVSLGVVPVIDVAPIYLGKEKGFFAKRGIDLRLETGQGGAAILPGVMSGQLTFGFSNMTSLLVARDKGLDVKVVANGTSSTGKAGGDFGAVVVRGDSPVQSAKDLAGRSVAVNTLKNIGDTTVRASVRKAGGDPAAVRFTELGFPDMPAALAKGNVDAAWVVEPFLTMAKNQGARVVAWNFVDTAPKLTVAAYFTSAKLRTEQPDLVKRFAEAAKESATYAQEHPDEARQAITSYTKITKEQVAGLTLPDWPAEVNRESVATLAELAPQDGLVTGKPDLTALLP